jgi:hypothetical protein
VTIVAIAAIAALVAVTVLAARAVRAERAASAKQLAEFALRWEDERRELLTRIQHPNLVPVRQQRREPSEPPKDYSGAMRSIGRAVPPRGEDDEGDGE